MDSANHIGEDHSGKEFSLTRQICIVSSSGTFINGEVTSKEQYVLEQSVKLKESLTVCCNWLADVCQVGNVQDCNKLGTTNTIFLETLRPVFFLCYSYNFN